jgi:choline/glycine/proline betaine transport protein
VKAYFDIHKPVFYPSAAVTLVFVSITLVFRELSEKYFGQFQAFMSDQFGWFINLSINYYLFFVLFLALTSFGKVRIGGREAKPEFSKFSWVAMLFSAGMGIGLVYFSVAEPLYHYIHPVDTGLTERMKARQAMQFTFFHYGFHVWGIYSLLGIALGYFCFYEIALKSHLYLSV